MSKYAVGDKFIVEIKEVLDGDNGTLYRSIFSTLVFDEYGLDKLKKYEDSEYAEGVKEGLNSFDCEVKKAYDKGLQDAWELARKTYNFSCNILKEIYGVDGGFYDLIKNYTPQEALEILEAYEKSKQIQVGDVVYADDEPDSFGVVTWINEKLVYVMWDDGSCGDETNIEELHKTGRHIDISNLLEQIRGNE